MRIRIRREGYEKSRISQPTNKFKLQIQINKFKLQIQITNSIMTSLATIDYKDIDIYASKKAASYGMKGNFQGKDNDGKEIESSGSGRNEGKFTLKDVRKCPNVQKWIEDTKVDGDKETKVVSKFSSKTAEKLFSEKFPGMNVEQWQGNRSGKRTKGSITCKDIKDFLKSNGEQAVVTDGKKFTTKKMKERIDNLVEVLKTKAKEYLEQHQGEYKSGKVWGKKEVDAAIKYSMEN